MTVKKIDLNRFLDSTSLLNMFSPLEDSDMTRFLNVFKTSSVNKDIINNDYMFESYTVTHNDWLDNISGKYYGTPTLWWVIAMFNDISNPFEDLEENKVIKILKYQYINIILSDITNIGNV